MKIRAGSNHLLQIKAKAGIKDLALKSWIQDKIKIKLEEDQVNRINSNNNSRL